MITRHKLTRHGPIGRDYVEFTLSNDGASIYEYTRSIHYEYDTENHPLEWLMCRVSSDLPVDHMVNLYLLHGEVIFPVSGGYYILNRTIVFVKEL